MICAAAVFSQEKVGTVSFTDPSINIVIDFYESNIEVDAVIEILQNYLISTGIQGLRTIDNKTSNTLYDEINRRSENITDWSNLELTWGTFSPYFAIKYTLSYKGSDYFIINILPEDSYWFFIEEK